MRVSTDHNIIRHQHLADILILQRMQGDQDILGPRKCNIEPTVLKWQVARPERHERIRPEQDHHPVLQPFCRINRLDLDTLIQHPRS